MELFFYSLAAAAVTYLGGPLDGFTTNITASVGEYSGGDTDHEHYVYGPYDGTSNTIAYYGQNYPSD